MRLDYSVQVIWTGAGRSGTTDYGSYERSHVIAISGKPPIMGSADLVFRGDGTLHNPEELLLASISACHMLWYLHLCAINDVVVREYTDDAGATMADGQFISAVLRPKILITAKSDLEIAHGLHGRAHDECFIARSVNFGIKFAPQIRQAADDV